MNNPKKWIELYYDAGFSCFPIELKYYENEKGIKKKKMVNPFKWQSGDIKKSLALNLVENRHNGLAIKTGKKSKFIVLDLDKKDGKIYGLDWLKKNGVIIPKNAPKVETISGGLHYYFKWTDKLKVKTTKAGIVQGVDIRGEGGIIFAPPTMIGIDEYSFLGKPDFKNIPDMPKELIDAINKTYTNTDDKERKNRQYGAPNSSKYGDVNRCCKFLRNHKLNYDEWIKCGMSLAEMKEDGRNFFFLLSDNEFYNDSDSDINKKFDNFLKTTQKVKIASLFEIAKKYGFKPQYTGYMFTDLDNGKLLADNLDGKIKHLPDVKIWAVWDKKENIWFETKDIFPYCSHLYKLVDNVIPNDYEKRGKLVTRSKSHSSVNNAAKFLTSFDNIKSSKKDFIDKQNKYIIPLKNGLYDLINFKFIPYDSNPSHFFFQKANINYDQNATCPKFDKFIAETFENEDVAMYVRQFLGYALSGDISARKFMIFVGEGANGKSTLINIIHYILGGFSDKIAPETFKRVKYGAGDSETRFSAMEGIRFGFVSETNKGDYLDSGKIKDFTGGEPVKARKLFQNSYTYQPTAKVVISTNDEPNFNGADRALLTRLAFIFFHNTPHTIDTKLLDKLIEEAPGIFNWMLKGWEDYNIYFLDNIPGSVRRDVQEYAEDNSIEKQFFDECMVDFAGDDTLIIPTHLIFKVFKAWKSDRGESDSGTGTIRGFSLNFVKIVGKNKKKRSIKYRGFSEMKFNLKGKEIMKMMKNVPETDIRAFCIADTSNF
jgi:putative DNA primase/helicase